MLPFRYLFRIKFLQSPISSQINKLSTSSQCNSKAKDPIDSPNEKLDHEKSVETKKADAIKKLNNLLQSMVDENEVTKSTKPITKPIEMARPKQRELKKKYEPTGNTKQPDTVENAAKQVAAVFGGDVLKTETELLSKLRSHKTESSSSDDSSSSSDSSDDESSEPKKVVPAPTVAKKEEIPKTILKPTKSTINLSELIIGMKIDRSKKPAAEGRASQVRKVLGGQHRGEDRPWRERAPYDEGKVERSRAGGRRPDNARWEDRSRNIDDHRQRMAPVKVNLLGSEPLGIFSAKSTKDQPSSDVATGQDDHLATWRLLHERELRMAVTHPPSNFFEEMILWTEQGKLWKFPIDNEQGMDEERRVYFAEHVFLEGHLEPWCQRKGPVRHFMELVCVGLSKNPYLTAKEKRDHIDWFREYFQQKQDILRDTGAITMDNADSEKKTIAAS